MGLGEFFALSCALTWAFAVIMFRQTGATLSPFATNLFKNSLVFLLMIPTIALTSGLEMPTWETDDLSIMLLSGLVGIAVADTLYLHAINILGASRAAVVASMYSPFVVISSALILGERLTLIQGAGFLLVIGGIYLVASNKKNEALAPGQLSTGILSGLGAVFFMAIAVVSVKPQLENLPFLWVVEIRMFGGIAGMFMQLLLSSRLRTRLIREFAAFKRWRMLTMASLLGTYISMLMYLAGYKYTSASVASILNETASVFIIILAWLILKESMNARKALGSSITFAGVLLVLVF